MDPSWKVFMTCFSSMLCAYRKGKYAECTTSDMIPMLKECSSWDHSFSTYATFSEKIIFLTL